MARPAARLALALLTVWIVAAAIGPRLATLQRDGASSSLGLVLLGARDSAVIVGIVLALALPGGFAVGVLAGAGGRGRDTLLARGLEVASFWPTVLLVPILTSTLSLPRPLLLGLAVALGESLRTARMVRGEVQRQRFAPYVVAARALGASRIDVFRAHVVPHATTPILVAAAFAGATTIATDTAISFLGLAGGAPTSWGGALASSLAGGPPAIGPLVAAVATTAAFYVLAGALADAIDPRPFLGPR
ncbi:MAG: ABC transporter permease subunit [Polyangiaceae bacterium]|nr:ABC transporter permease subunit [Polyangiaceae bacterium]